MTTIETAPAPTAKMLPVLLIDDSALDRELTMAYLGRAWPFESALSVEFAQDGLEALEKMHTTRFALIVLDWNLPRANGGHVLREMRRNGVFIPVIVLSGLERVDIPENLEALGAAFLNKNCLNSAALYDAISKALATSGMKRAKPTSAQPGKNQLVFHSHTPYAMAW